MNLISKILLSTALAGALPNAPRDLSIQITWNEQDCTSKSTSQAEPTRHRTLPDPFVLRAALPDSQRGDSYNVGFTESNLPLTINVETELRLYNNRLYVGEIGDNKGLGVVPAEIKAPIEGGKVSGSTTLLKNVQYGPLALDVEAVETKDGLYLEMTEKGKSAPARPLAWAQAAKLINLAATKRFGYLSIDEGSSFASIFATLDGMDEGTLTVSICT